MPNKSSEILKFIYKSHNFAEFFSLLNDVNIVYFTTT